MGLYSGVGGGRGNVRLRILGVLYEGGGVLTGFYGILFLSDFFVVFYV